MMNLAPKYLKWAHNEHDDVWLISHTLNDEYYMFKITYICPYIIVFTI